MNLSQKALLCLMALTATTAVGAFTPALYSGPSTNNNNYQWSQKIAVQEQASAATVSSSTTSFRLHSSFDDEDDDIEDEITDIDEIPPEDYLVNVGELEGDESDSDDVGMEDDGEPPAWYSLQLRMEESRNKFKLHDKDTGSPEFQVAGMTERIGYLTGHLKEHPKDFSTRRGLVALVNKRRRVLNWLSTENEERYNKLILSLGIRHKAPGRVFNKEEQYGQFPRQKAVKKHLVKKAKLQAKQKSRQSN